MKFLQSPVLLNPHQTRQEGVPFRHIVSVVRFARLGCQLTLDDELCDGIIEAVVVVISTWRKLLFSSRKVWVDLIKQSDSLEAQKCVELLVAIYKLDEFIVADFCNYVVVAVQTVFVLNSFSH